MGMSILQPSGPSKPPRCSGPERNIRLVYVDGNLHDFTEAISAGEALQSSLLQQHSKADMSSMMLFNNFLVCDSASLRIGKRACPIHPDMQLEVGHLYYVLPIRTFQHRLSWSHISSLAAMAMPASSSSFTASAHMSTNQKSLPPVKRSPVTHTLARISDIKSFLRLLLHRRLRFGAGCRVNDIDVASGCTSTCSRSALQTEAWRAAGALVLSSKCSEASGPFHNICDNPEMNTKYVEHLIDRSKSWRPPLLTIQESIAV